MENKKNTNSGEVRLATYDNIKGIQKLYSMFYFMYTDALKKYIDKEMVFVYEKDNEIIGCVTYGMRKDKILMLVVNKKYRGQGIGKELFKISTETSNINELKIMATMSPVSSIPFWKKMGFEETSIIEKIH